MISQQAEFYSFNFILQIITAWLEFLNFVKRFLRLLYIKPLRKKFHWSAPGSLHWSLLGTCDSWTRKLNLVILCTVFETWCKWNQLGGGGMKVVDLVVYNHIFLSRPLHSSPKNVFLRMNNKRLCTFSSEMKHLL